GPRAAARPCLSAQAALAAGPPSVAAGLVRAALLPPRGPAARAKARLFLRFVSPGRKVKVKVKGAQIASFYRYKKAHLIQSFPRSPRPLPMGERERGKALTRGPIPAILVSAERVFSAPGFRSPPSRGAVFILQPLSHLVNSFLLNRKVYFPSSDNSRSTPSTERSREVNSSAKAYSIVTAWSEWFSAFLTASRSPVRW